MGRSGGSTSCLKLIPCAGGKDSVDRDDLGVPESKGSSDRSKWSFRKKSARHRVLSSSAASEAPSESKATPDSVAAGFATQSSSGTPEKSLAVQWKEEKTVREFPVDLKDSETVEIAAVAEEYGRTDVADCIADNYEIGDSIADEEGDGAADEERVIVIQSAVRSFLAQRDALLKHDNIVKVQAAVRGHIVRKHAVGSLRCVQAIVKMQNLVRERQARLNGSVIHEKGKEPGFMYVSIEKLLSNAFARQLMESTPKSKKIDIKCDPSKPDSGWKWLERWMLASSTETAPSPGLEPAAEIQAEEITVKPDIHFETEVSSPDHFQSRDDADIEALQLQAPSEVQDCQQIAPKVDQSVDEIHPRLVGEDNNLSDSDVDSPILVTPVSEESDTEEMKPSTGSGKASNPSFIEAQAKFQELSSVSVSSFNQEASQESELPVEIHAPSKTRATDHHPESSLVTGSECGTELSISSTLDSPDRSDAGVVDSVLEARNLEKEAHSPKNGLDLEVEEKKTESKTVESNKLTSIEENGAHSPNNDLDSRVDEKIPSDFAQNSENSVADEKIEIPDSTPNAPDIEHVSSTTAKAAKKRFSPEPSPTKSHKTVPESSQGTPSSQVSVKSMKSRSGKGRSNRHLATAKESNLDGSEKRRNSFGSSKAADHGDQEPRDSSSSNSLPSYMQATESARAKALSLSSPRSSPDMQDKDFIKKRQSLPGASTRQGSPHVHRAQQGVKANGTHSPQERKWKR